MFPEASLKVRLSFAFLLLLALLTAENVRGASVRYRVLHLQGTYGEETFFTGLSPGGSISGAAQEGPFLVMLYCFRDRIGRRPPTENRRGFMAFAHRHSIR